MLVKICGLTSPDDALLAAQAGADFLGIVLSPASPRCATIDNARKILRLNITQRIYLVFGYDDTDYIRETFMALADAKTALQVMADHVQIDALLKLVPTNRIMPSLSAAERVSPEILQRWKKHPLVLFDSHRSQARIAGGTGKTFNPKNIAGIRRPYLLAGGLNPDNVAAIVKAVNPTGVDVASGTEVRPGVKDPDKIISFVQNAKRAAKTTEGIGRE